MTSQLTSSFQLVSKSENEMATSTKAIPTFALSKYKQLLDKHAVLLQLSHMADVEETMQNVAFFHHL